MSDKYKNAGVDIHAGYESVELIKKHTKKTNRPGVLGGIGSFGGMFEILHKYDNPVLVSGTDGVGTKLLLAITYDRHDTIGQDVVAMCVNDIITQGAEPLVFLDYLAVDKNRPRRIEQIVKGVSEGCIQANCALVGGETAEMPGMYSLNHYDIAGFSVGVVEKSKIIDGSNIEEGNLLIGLPSSGIHSNGYSLVRKIFDKEISAKANPYIESLGANLIDELLKPTKIYVKTALELCLTNKVKGMVHVTGGGFIENIPRVLPRGLGVEVYKNAWTIPNIFKLMMSKGSIPEEEMFNVFNMGVGFIFVIANNDYLEVMQLLQNLGEKPIVLGKVTRHEGVKIL